MLYTQVPFLVLSVGKPLYLVYVPSGNHCRKSPRVCLKNVEHLENLAKGETTRIVACVNLILFDVFFKPPKHPLSFDLGYRQMVCVFCFQNNWSKL